MKTDSYLEELSPTLFWDVELPEMNPDDHQRFIISRVMERGTREDVQLTFKQYPTALILRELQSARSLDRKTLPRVLLGNN